MNVRRVLSVTIILLLMCSLPLPARASVDLKDPQYVVDDAGVLSSDTKKKILDTNEMLWNECSGAEFVVVTVNYPPSGLDNEEYALKIFNTWHIGGAEEDNGLLLVLYTEADDFWLQPGKGVFSSPYVDEIADLVSDDSAFFRAVQKDRDEEAVLLLLDGVTKWYREHYRSVSFSPVSSSGPAYYSVHEENNDLQTVVILLVLILLFIVVTSPVRCYRRYGRFGVWPFFYFSNWWPSRRRVVRPVSYRSPTKPGSGIRPSSSSRPSGRSSSGSSFRAGGGRSGNGGFGGGRSSGGFSGRPGGGGRSGSGGFGHR